MYVIYICFVLKKFTCDQYRGKARDGARRTSGGLHGLNDGLNNDDTELIL